MLTEIRYETPIESIADIEGDVIFLAGPTVRGHQPHLTSWRFAAIEELKRQGFDGTVIIPEFVSKTESDKHRTDLPLWEFEGLKRAVKIVYGRPDDAYRMSYLDIMWNAAIRDYRSSYDAFYESAESVPAILNTLKDTVAASIALVNEQKKYIL